MRTRPFAILVLLAAFNGPAGAQAPTASVWEASSGLLPTQVCPAWSLTDTSTSDPVLAPSGLTISDAPGEDLFYFQTCLLYTSPSPRDS